ncbi:MAG: hypothetical protein KGJ94_01985, partial [Xanthomonadaceae bacterium]|nr:hypothetical protein [Xanthomonadaceae bacterium]
MAAYGQKPTILARCGFDRAASALLQSRPCGTPKGKHRRVSQVILSLSQPSLRIIPMLGDLNREDD